MKNVVSKYYTPDRSYTGATGMGTKDIAMAGGKPVSQVG
jgi:hypothetical protein